MEQKVYFDDDGIALGTSEDYFGEYFASEIMTIPDGVEIEGKRHALLEALSNNYRKALRERY